jgi:hypothetical protein
MKRRTVKLTLWHVARQDPDGQIHEPELRFTKQAVEDYLNKIYGKQTNTFWDVTINGFQTPAPVVWDVGRDSNFGVTDGDPLVISPHNGNLDVAEDEPSTEQMTIASTNRTDDQADINAYIVGGTESFKPWKIENGQLKLQFSLTGVASPERFKVWVNGTAQNLSGPALEAALKRQLNCLAHEIGHVMIGPGHPGPGDGGPVPLPGTNHRDRLMWVPWPGDSAVGAKRSLLVKEEWDKIDGWLGEVVD